MKNKMLKKVCMLITLSLVTVSMVACSGNKNSTTTAKFDEKKIKIGDGDNKIDGILTMPKEALKPPVVILVQGSGQSDMDETISKVGKNKPFKDIAEGLAEKGIATIRYNKRFYQYPKLAPKNLTIQDEVLNDVNFAINLAYNNEDLDNKKIYVLGHSLGGMLAPEIAKNNKEVTGIISLAGSPRKLEDIILDQNKAVLDKMTDKTESEKATLLGQVQDEVNKVKAIKANDESTTIFGVNSEYWGSLNNINIPEIVKGLNIPMLFLQGDADFQVYTDVDFKAWKDILNGNNNATFKSYQNLNHLFMQTSDKGDVTEYDIHGNVDKAVISDIADWINK